ncbi:MAG: tRNA lysidine(34) synthetase TilS [Marinovum sp.]|nr:tRNA lysidine(34) synthetase TilS [Marinovum sp.]
MSVKDPISLIAAFADAIQKNTPAALGKKPIAHVTLAVSGGGDSMALMHLAAQWASARGIRCHVVTIDHGLRTASAAEAQFVAQAAAELGLTHKTLCWADWNGQGNLQDQARQARYRLIDDARGDCRLVLMGHTLDDQAETFLMRLKRGSGVDGLAGIPACRFVGSTAQDDGYWVLRPLLGIQRQALRDYLNQQNAQWVEDPSNQDPSYERIQMRQLLNEISGAGLGASVLAETATRMAQAKEVLDQQVQRLACDLVQEHHGDIVIDLPTLFKQPTELADRLVAAALCWVSSNPYRPRYAALRRCLDAVAGGAAQSLHGCVLYQWKGRLRITREYQAVANMSVALAQKVLWDCRWHLRLAQPVPPKASGWVVKPLGEAGAQAARPFLTSDIPFRSLTSHPALFDQSGVLQTVPGLSKNPPFEAEFDLRPFDQSLINH